MNRVRLALGGLLVALLVYPLAGARAEKPADKPKANKDKIVGVWEFVKSSDPKTIPPPGATIEFTKDGKLKMVVKIEGKELPIPEGKEKRTGTNAIRFRNKPDSPRR